MKAGEKINNNPSWFIKTADTIKSIYWYFNISFYIYYIHKITHIIKTYNIYYKHIYKIIG